VEPMAKDLGVCAYLVAPRVHGFQSNWMNMHTYFWNIFVLYYTFENRPWVQFACLKLVDDRCPVGTCSHVCPSRA
jgi:hypothetical protein